MEKGINLITKTLNWLGTPHSLTIHTVFFIIMFISVPMGWDLNQMLLVLTTVLSIEAIYLALFLQMAINKTTESLSGVAEDIDEIERDIDIIQADDKKDDIDDEEVSETLKTIEKRLFRLQKDLKVLKKKGIM